MSYNTVDEDDFAEFKALTAAEARRWRESHPTVSVWEVVLYQILFGLAAILVAWLLGDGVSATLSVAYGVLVVLVPSVVMARGVSAKRGAAVLRFLFWEFCKIVLTVAMLVAVGRYVTGLNWLALLAGMIVTMKAYWVLLYAKPGLLKLTDKEKS